MQVDLLAYALRRESFDPDGPGTGRGPRATLVWLLGAPTTLWLTRWEPGDWYLQSIAVDASVRGGGVGSKLRGDALECARAAGAGRVALDVRVGDDVAQRLYEHVGMRVIAQSPGPTLPGVHRVHRMADLTRSGRPSAPGGG